VKAGSVVRAAILGDDRDDLPPTPAYNYGITHNPSRDTEKRTREVIAKAEERYRNGELDDDDDEEEAAAAAARPKRTKRARAANVEQMREKFEGLYHSHRTESRTETSPPEMMPRFHQYIWVKWQLTDHRYNLCRVVDVEWDAQYSMFVYTLENQTNPDGSILDSDHTGSSGDLRLRREANHHTQWAFANPNPPGTWGEHEDALLARAASTRFTRPRGGAPHGPNGIAMRWNHTTGQWEVADGDA